MNLDLDALCDDFEKALERGQRPSIREWAKTDAAIPELAALELHSRLAAGEAVTARDYFEQYPTILKNPEAAIRLVAIEYRAAVNRDCSISEWHFRERYPELANAQEWSNGPWVNDTVQSVRASTQVYSPSGQSVVLPASADLPTYVKSLIRPPFPEHPNDLGRLGDYRILGILGRGGMGVVLKGANVHSGHPAAIKLMVSPEMVLGRERFLREARVAQKIDHPRVVPIYHVGEDNGIPYIAMKLLEGQSLRSRIEAVERVSPAEIVRIGREIAEGLDAAHQLQLVHRDLKPDNIWLEHGEYVRILDFGLARPIGDTEIEGVESFTKTGALTGTPAFMSPEQADGQAVDARTDLWSLGVVLYRMATKQYPFGNEPLMKVLKSIANDTPKTLKELVPEMPVRLSNLVAKLLEKDPENRPANAGEVIRELDRVWDESGGSEPTVTFVDKPTALSTKKPPRFVSCSVTLTIAMALLVGVGVYVSDLGKRPSVAVRPNQSEDIKPPPPTMAVAPLAVKFISLQHFANKTPGKEIPEVESRGILGKDSFETLFGDRLKVEVELTRPAYCYVVAFRPDGMAECIYPEPMDADKPPELTDRPRYPSKSRGDYYGLTDGTGQWIIGVVASPKPLPSFNEAIKGKTIPKFAGGKTTADAVLWDDGKSVETLTKLGITRGAGATVQGTNPLTEATNWLRKLAPENDAVAASMGFLVKPRN